MKAKYYFVFLLCFLQSKLTAQSWIKIGHGLLPWGYTVDDVSAVGDSVVWVSASLRQNIEQPSIIFRSTDGGQNWESHFLTDCFHCKTVDLEAVDLMTAWMTTYSIHGGVDRLFKTTDGGQSWNLMSTRPGSGGHIQAYDAQHISCFDGRDACWTEDGGEYWESGIISTHSTGFQPVTNLPGNTLGDTSWLGMAGQANPIYPGEAKLIRAMDYGRTFEFIPVDIDSIGAIPKVFFTDPLHGILWYWTWEYYVDFDFGDTYWTYCTWGCKDSLATTEDGGQTWKKISQPLPELNNLYAIPGLNGAYITTNHNSVAWTHNNGESWKTRKLHEYISCIDFTSPTTGYMGVNANNFSDPLLLKWNGDFTTSTYAPVNEGKLQLGPNPTDGLLHFLGEEDSQPPFHVFIYDINGKLVMTESVQGNQFSIGHLTSGLYIVKVESSSGSNIFKIVK